MKGKYELEFISTCSMKRYYLSLISNTKFHNHNQKKKNDFGLEKISYNNVKTNQKKLSWETSRKDEQSKLTATYQCMYSHGIDDYI